MSWFELGLWSVLSDSVDNRSCRLHTFRVRDNRRLACPSPIGLELVGEAAGLKHRPLLAGSIGGPPAPDQYKRHERQTDHFGGGFGCLVRFRR